jgi:hypothetical protein
LAGGLRAAATRRPLDRGGFPGLAGAMDITPFVVMALALAYSGVVVLAMRR